jgi:hypothetical protein
MSQKIFCPSCHIELDSTDSFCPKCGIRVKPVYKKSGTFLDGMINPSLLISEVNEKVEELQKEVKIINSKLDKILEKLG